MSDPNHFTISTPYGDCHVTAVNGGLLYVDASSNGKFLTYRGKNYALCFRLTSADGLRWGLVDDVWGHPVGDWNKRIPTTYLEVMVAEITDRCAIYVQGHPNLLNDAERESLETQLAAEEERLLEATKEFNKRIDAVNELKRRLFLTQAATRK
jgi:enoyl-CoA hydratase/carnithine racemase